VRERVTIGSAAPATSGWPTTKEDHQSIHKLAQPNGEMLEVDCVEI